MNKRTLGLIPAFSVTSKGDLFDMLCNLAYVKNESRSTRAALSRLIDAVNGEVHNLLVVFVL